MKIGITSDAYFGKEWNIDGLRRMKKHGFGFMDLNLSDTELPLYHYTEAKLEKTLRETREKINSQDIEICQTHGPWRFPPCDFTKEERAERFDKMAKAVRATRILGAKLFVIHPLMPFGWDNEPDPKLSENINLEFFTRLVNVGEENDVVICLENMPMTALSVSSPLKTLESVKRINSPYMRMCLDTGHSVLLGMQPGEAVRQIGKEYLACLHVHDNDGRSDLHKIPFSGVIDWSDFSRALNEICFDGVMCLETRSASTLNAPSALKEYFEVGLASLAKALTELPE